MTLASSGRVQIEQMTDLAGWGNYPKFATELLEPRLPPAVFYNLILTATKPARTGLSSTYRAAVSR